MRLTVERPSDFVSGLLNVRLRRTSGFCDTLFQTGDAKLVAIAFEQQTLELRTSQVSGLDTTCGLGWGESSSRKAAKTATTALTTSTSTNEDSKSQAHRKPITENRLPITPHYSLLKTGRGRCTESIVSSAASRTSIEGSELATVFSTARLESPKFSSAKTASILTS